MKRYRVSIRIEERNDEQEDKEEYVQLYDETIAVKWDEHDVATAIADLLTSAGRSYQRGYERLKRDALIDARVQLGGKP